MSRLAEKLTGAFASGAKRAVLDPSFGGMNGWAPEYSQWANNQAHVSRPVHCILLEPPKMFDAFTTPEKWRQCLKAILEMHSYTIEGLDAELKVDVDSHQIDGSGELQHEVTNVTRGVSTPKHQYVEKYGRPIQTFHEFWIRYGLMDPSTKFALLGTTPAANGANATVKDLTAAWYTATCIYIQPDPLHKYVDKAWLRSNMFPGGAGVNTSKRDLKSGQEITMLDIEYYGFMTVGAGVDALAQEILDSATIANADPFMRPAHLAGRDPDVAENGTWASYAAQLGKVSSEAVSNVNASGVAGSAA